LQVLVVIIHFVAAWKTQSLLLFLSPVPSDYPQNLNAVTVSSTEIAVSWNEVPRIGRNGIIIQYEVQYEPLMILTGDLTMNTSNTSALLRDLQEYTEYNITIRAYTSVGPGPLSPSVTNRTFEDGKLFRLLFCYQNYSNLSLFRAQCTSRQCSNPHQFLPLNPGDMGPSTKDRQEWNHHPV